MKCLLPAVWLACAGSALAQQPVLEVQDLLRPTAATNRADGRSVVRRVFPTREWDRRHAVLGEGYLLGSPPEDEFSYEWQEWPGRPRAFFDHDSLRAALAAIRGEEDPIDFIEVGSTVRLRTSYPEQVVLALAALRASLPPSILVDVRLERLVDGEVELVLSGSEPFTNGEVAVLGDLQRARLVTDLEVEIAQAAATGNPVETEITTGTSLGLRARPLPGEEAAVVEVMLRLARPFEEQPMPSSVVLGAVDRVALRVDEAGFAFRVSRDAPAVHEWTTLDGARMRLTCTARWQPRPAPGGDGPGVLVTPLLGSHVYGFRSTRDGEPEDVAEAFWAASLVDYESRAVEDGSVFLVDGETTVLVFTADGRRAAERIQKGIAAALQPVDVAVEVFDVAAGAEVAATGPLPAGAVARAELRGAALSGLPVCFTSLRERTYLRDWDVEVAQASRIADPKVSLIEDGWFATVQVDRDPAGHLTCELNLDLVDFVEMKTRALAISSDSVAATAEQQIVLPREVINVEQPVLRSLDLGTVVELDQGGAAVLRRAAPGVVGAGRELIVRINVK